MTNNDLFYEELQIIAQHLYALAHGLSRTLIELQKLTQVVYGIEDEVDLEEFFQLHSMNNRH